MMRWCTLSAFLLVAISLAPVTTEAQSQTATVTGKVTRHGRAPERLMVRVGSNYGYTDVAGRYRLRGVPFGRRTIEVVRGNSVLLSESVDVNQQVVQRTLVLP